MEARLEVPGGGVFAVMVLEPGPGADAIIAMRVAQSALWLAG